MSAKEKRMLAGISVPDTTLVEQALDYAHERCEPYLFNHVVRSWLFAERIGQLQGIDHDAEVLAVGTLLHDITLNERFAGPRRFEVEAADQARSFAEKAGMDRHRAQQVWDGVALNSTPSIGPIRKPRSRCARSVSASMSSACNTVPFLRLKSRRSSRNFPGSE
jgi:hypothetical protein